jgi:hypothetical protein
MLVALVQNHSCLKTAYISSWFLYIRQVLDQRPFLRKKGFFSYFAVMSKILNLVLILVAVIVSAASAAATPDYALEMPTYPNLQARQASAPAASPSAAASSSKGASAAPKPKKSNFVSAPILESGTLFYVGIAASLCLWTTGKSIDYALQRQERYARYLATK